METLVIIDLSLLSTDDTKYLVDRKGKMTPIVVIIEGKILINWREN